jgi:hypothetical protein
LRATGAKFGHDFSVTHAVHTSDVTLSNGILRGQLGWHAPVRRGAQQC